MDGSSQGAYQQVRGGKDVQSVDRLILTEFAPLSLGRLSHIRDNCPDSGQGKSTQVGGKRRQEEVTSNPNPQTTSKYRTNNLKEDVVFYCAQPKHKSKTIMIFLLRYS